MRPAIPHMASGSSGMSWRPWAAAGCGWQGRRPAGMPPAFQGWRTQPAADRRLIQGRQGVPEGPLGQHLQVLLALPVGDRREVPLPLVALVVLEDLVQAARQRAADDLVLLERHERGAEAVGHLLDLRALLEEVVRVALLRWPRVDLAPHAVEAGAQQRRDGEVRVAGAVDAA